MSFSFSSNLATILESFDKPLLISSNSAGVGYFTLSTDLNILERRFIFLRLGVIAGIIPSFFLLATS